MRRRGIPLFSVESHLPASEFDVLAFNLSAELVYTNLLNCIDLAGVPVRAEARGPEHPLVVAGGHCTFNPEPLADFVDVFAIGDGEEVVGEITGAVQAWTSGGRTTGSRQRLLRDLARLPGVYVPSCYDVAYDGPRLVAVTPRYGDVPERVEKRTIADLAAWPYPKRQLVPLTEVVHDRLNVEIFRGCTRGCRFCQAGMITRPVRERPAAQVRQMVSDGLQRTGYDEVSLTSLSSADFSDIDGVVGGIINDPACRGQVSVSLPSLRVDVVHRRYREPDTEGAPYGTDVCARGRHLADAPGHQQADPGRGSVWRGRCRLFPGMAASKALLPHRTAHRDRRRHPRDRQPGPPVRGHRAALSPGRIGYRLSRGLRAEAADALSVVRPGQARGVGPQDRIAARCHSPGPGHPAALARPEGLAGRGAGQPRRSPDRTGHRNRVAARGHLPGVVRAFLAGSVGRGHG